MALLWHELRAGNEYIVLHKKNKMNLIQLNEIYKGTFIERIPSTGSRVIPIEKRVLFEQWYEIVTMWYSVFSVNNDIKYFCQDDMYYDLNKIRENANKAREQMEKRALNKILKELVNETFEWI
jgi:hypothetical protein